MIRINCSLKANTKLGKVRVYLSISTVVKSYKKKAGKGDNRPT
jgi:hypothetical protein